MLVTYVVGQKIRVITWKRVKCAVTYSVAQQVPARVRQISLVYTIMPVSRNCTISESSFFILIEITRTKITVTEISRPHACRPLCHFFGHDSPTFHALTGRITALL